MNLQIRFLLVYSMSFTFDCLAEIIVSKVYISKVDFQNFHCFNIAS